MTISCAKIDTQYPQIRLARQTDALPLLLSGRARTITKSHPYKGRAIEAEQEPSLKGTTSGPTLTLLAEVDGKVVATVDLTIQANQVGLIHGLWIASTHQESTLAMRMMVEVLRESKKLGCQR